MRRVRVRAPLVVALALVFAIVIAGQAFAKSSLSLSLKPAHPSANSKYALTISGRAPSGGTFGKHHNRSGVILIEQLGGTCASTVQAEAKKHPAKLIGAYFVSAGRFTFVQHRRASTAGTNLRICGYLSTSAHKVVARATVAYHT